MPTPLTPDEEFDAQFRQGFEHYPEQPEDPAAWHRMELLLDADLRQQGLRRQVLRLLVGEALLLLVALWGILHFALLAGQPRELAGANTLQTNTIRQNTSATLIKQGAATVGTASQDQAASSPASAPHLAATKASAPANQATTFNDKDLATSASLVKAHSANSASSTHLRATVSSAESARMSLGTASRPGRHYHHKRQAERQTATVLPLASATSFAANKRHFGKLNKQGHTHNQPTSIAETQALQLAQRSQRHWPSKAGGLLLATASQQRALAGGSYGRQLTRHPLAKPTSEATATAAKPGRAAASAAATSTELPIDLLATRPFTNDLPFLLPDSLTPVALAAPLSSADSLPKPKPTMLAYRLRVGLVAAPELSTVRADRLTAPGTNVGVQLDYQLARRWRLSTSFLLTNKRYVARGTDYHLPDGYTLPHGWVISNVDAVCRIIDIPLNLRYDLWQRPRYQIFASAGISSLLMKREQYTYDYELVYGKSVPSYTWELSNGSQHYLKVLNLSAGYERAVGQRWTVQAEPFVKLPLAGVGFGAVRLSSAGVFFSLKYGLLPLRTASQPAR